MRSMIISKYSGYLGYPCNIGMGPGTRMVKYWIT